MITEKTMDLPPRGPANTDPISGAAGSHPIETGVGTALGGAATGFAMGVAAGPVGAVAGAIIGGVAGAFAGRGLGEYIDPTTEDDTLRDEFETLDYVQDGDTFEAFQPAYRHGAQAEAANSGRSFDIVESELQDRYEAQQDPSKLPWQRVRGAVSDGYTRAAEIRKERSARSQSAP